MADHKSDESISEKKIRHFAAYKMHADNSESSLFVRLFLFFYEYSYKCHFSLGEKTTTKSFILCVLSRTSSLRPLLRLKLCQCHKVHVAVLSFVYDKTEKKMHNKNIV